VGNVAVYKKGTTDFFSQGLGLLSDVVSSNLKQTVSSTGNVEQKLEVEYPIDGYLVSELVEGAILRVSVSTDKSDYGVFEIVDTLKDDSGTITVYGDPYYNRILRMSFDNGGVFTKFSSVQSALNAAKQNITGFPADFNLISNLSTSVDLSANTYDTFGTFLEALNSAVNGNIKYSLNSIQIYSALGKDITDITLRDDMNTSSVKITTDFSGIINKVIPVLPVLDKDGNATDQTKVGTIVTSKYSNQFLDYWAGKIIQFDTQDLANTYFDRTNADRPVQTVDVDPIGLDDDFSTINIFDTIELYSTRLDYTDKLRVSERVFDTLAENVTSFKLGSSSVNIFNQINEQNDQIFNNVVKLTNAAISANGKGIDYFGQAQPSSPKEGDTWFWDDGTDFGIKQYTNGEWVDLAGSNTAEKITAGVTEAVAQANAHTDEVKQGLSTDISTAKSQAASQASAAETNAKSAATSQFNQAQNALSAAKTDLTNSIASEASARNQAVAAANSQAQTYASQAKADALNAVTKEVTDRQNAVSALDTKATNAVNQAKSDINDTINAISVGGRNLLLDTSISHTGVGNNSTNGNFNAQGAVWKLSGGKRLSDLYNQYGETGYLTVSFDWVATGDTISGQFNPQWNSSPFGNLANTGPIKPTSTNISGHYESTTRNLKDSGYEGSNATSIMFRQDSLQGNITISNLKLESGNKATDWTAAPEDVVLDYTTKDNQIKETITQYQTTNDGKVTKAQTDATTALGLVATKVSQTDYDTKTGDLTTKYTQVKQTVDSQATDIVDIRKTASSQASKINSISSDVDGTKQSISDIETTQDSQSDKINQITTDVNGTKQSITDIQTKNGDQDTRMGNIETSVSGVKSDFSTYKTTNDGAVKTAQTTAQTAVDGLKTKVSQTDYNTKTGQLQTDLTATTQTANQAKTDIVSIKEIDGKQDARMTQIESDASGVKTTVSDLQTTQGKQSGDISTLQQRADGFDATVTKVDNLSVGGRNYVLNSSGLNGSPTLRPTLMGSTVSQSANFTITYPSDGILMTNGSTNTTSEWYYQVASAWTKFSDTPLNPGDQITFSADVMGTVPQAVLRYGFNGGTGGKEGSKNFDINNNGWTRVSITVTSTPTNTGLYFRIQGGKNNQYANGWSGGETLKFRYVKIEKGNIATDWAPAPEDLSGATAQAQLTADQATLSINNYKTDADGRISKAQADIVTNATAISQKVSQTDYNAKTGDLDTRVTKAQTTADGVVTTVGNYQTSNDARVKATETAIAQNAKDITLRATTSDLNSAKSDLNSSISQVKITADGISNFVRDSSGNISSDFQTALSKTSIIAGSTLASSIQKQTATQITSALTDNNGKIISLINQDTSGVQIAGKNIVLNGDTTVTGAFRVSQSNIANAAIGTAQIGDAAITSAKIANLDVSKITGDVTNFIKSNWNGTYGSTAITSTGMSVQTSSLLAEFVNNGMRLTSGGESVGGIGVQGLVGMPDNYQGLTFWLNGKAEYMGWAARDYGNETDNPTLKMAWYRGETKPSGAKTGFNFDDDVVFNKDIAVAGGTTQKLTMMTRNFNSNNYPWFGDNRGNAGISFGISQLYLHSDGTYWNMTSVIKALSGLGAIKIPSKINSDGTVGSWYNVTI
jgi:hypothetical protein